MSLEQLNENMYNRLASLGTSITWNAEWNTNMPHKVCGSIYMWLWYIIKYVGMIYSKRRLECDQERVSANVKTVYFYNKTPFIPSPQRNSTNNDGINTANGNKTSCKKTNENVPCAPDLSKIDTRSAGKDLIYSTTNSWVTSNTCIFTIHLNLKTHTRHTISKTIQGTNKIQITTLDISWKTTRKLF